MSDIANTKRYIEPTRRGRTLLMLSLLAFLYFIFSHALWVPQVRGRIEAGDPCVALVELRFLAAYFFVVSCLPSIYFGWQARRFWRVGQIPHPDAWVMFRTRVWTGFWHKLQVLLLGVVAVASLLYPVFLWNELQPMAWFFQRSC